MDSYKGNAKGKIALTFAVAALVGGCTYYSMSKKETTNLRADWQFAENEAFEGKSWAF